MEISRSVERFKEEKIYESCEIDIQPDLLRVFNSFIPLKRKVFIILYRN